MYYNMHTHKNEKQNDQHEEIKYHVQFWGNVCVSMDVRISMCKTVIMSAKRKAAAEEEEEEYYSNIIGCRMYTSHPIRTHSLSPQKKKKGM